MSRPGLARSHGSRNLSRVRRTVALGGTLIALTQCRAGGIACPKIGAPAILVYVADSATGEFIRSGAVLRVRSLGVTRLIGDVDPLGADSAPLIAIGPPGLYDVEVRKARYAPWMRLGVRVPSDHARCPLPIAQILRAKMRREP